MRGQTTLDFATGVSIFLLTVLFVFSFVPGTLQPFTQNSQAEMAGSDRVADLVVKDVLAEPGKPYVLDGNCTAKLMNDEPGPGCGFDGSKLSARLDLSDNQYINITVRGDPDGNGTEVLCWDRSGEQVVEASDSECDVELVAGNTPPSNGNSVVTSRRIVSIDGTTASVEVRLW